MNMITLRYLPALFIATTFNSDRRFMATVGRKSSNTRVRPARAESNLPESTISRDSLRFPNYSTGPSAPYNLLRRMYSAVDIMMLFLEWAGAVDGYVCWTGAVPGRAVFRFLSGGVIAALGK